MIFFFNDTATTEIYTLSLHDALPIYLRRDAQLILLALAVLFLSLAYVTRPTTVRGAALGLVVGLAQWSRDRKSTRLNSSHANISYAVFCLKKKNKSSTLPCLSYFSTN